MFLYLFLSKINCRWRLQRKKRVLLFLGESLTFLLITLNSSSASWMQMYITEIVVVYRCRGGDKNEEINLRKGLSKCERRTRTKQKRIAPSLLRTQARCNRVIPVVLIFGTTICDNFLLLLFRYSSIDASISITASICITNKYVLWN